AIGGRLFNVWLGGFEPNSKSPEIIADEIVRGPVPELAMLTCKTPGCGLPTGWRLGKLSGLGLTWTVCAPAARRTVSKTIPAASITFALAIASPALSAYGEKFNPEPIFRELLLFTQNYLLEWEMASARFAAFGGSREIQR